MLNILPAYPTYIAQTNLSDVVDLSEIKQSILDNQYDFETHNTLQNSISTHRIKNDFLRKYDMEDLLQQFDKCLTELTTAIEAPKLRIENNWINITYSGGATYPHIHAKSVYSGAFYVESCPENETLVMANPNQTQEILLDPRNIEVQTFPGTLILFPSYVCHYVRQVKSQRRIVISFNTWYE